jgi:phosphohistidine phosphatase SixA
MADEDAYFGAFAPGAVFLGTDPAERWTVDAFKSFALPYFTERDSAWIYVPQSRHVTVDPGGQVAWFDEELGNASYGLCRGTGALRRIDGRWRITLYDLTVPVPNDLMGAVVRRIKAREDGRPAVTTVWVVRHAEKTAEKDDPPLSVAGIARAQELARVLATAGIDAIYTSEYTRTKDTAAPLATRLGITPTVVTARDVVGLARTIANRGGTVLVVGHSNTVPAILRSLGATERIAITEDTYDDLFQLTLAPEGPTLHHLHYGLGS